MLQGRRNKAISMRPTTKVRMSSCTSSQPTPQATPKPTKHPNAVHPPPTPEAAAVILQRWWRAQLVDNTTPALVAAFVARALPTVAHSAHRRAPSDRQLCDTFDDLAARVADPTTLHAAQALLRRLEHRLPGPHSPRAIAHLGRLGSVPSQRYAPRVLLAAYMMVTHPAVVLGGPSTAADAVGGAAAEMLRALHAVLEQPRNTHYGALTAFDSAWTAYVERFVAWKLQDAAVIEVCTESFWCMCSRRISPTGRPGSHGG